ncbi:MAG: hypothetical protein LCI00_23115 [Chloroflexi bacterium]|nr:hypothetical protein [Chloroflexota bacterium]MCC6895944.1 hypothetical protein [Anaerolineae bacterium]
MDTKTLEQEILSEVRKLDIAMQTHLLEIVKGLTNTSRIIGEPGWKVIEAARQVNISPEDLQLMEAAIEEWCERVDDFPEVDFDG